MQNKARAAAGLPPLEWKMCSAVETSRASTNMTNVSTTKTITKVPTTEIEIPTTKATRTPTITGKEIAEGAFTVEGLGRSVAYSSSNQITLPLVPAITSHLSQKQSRNRNRNGCDYSQARSVWHRDLSRTIEPSFNNVYFNNNYKLNNLQRNLFGRVFANLVSMNVKTKNLPEEAAKNWNHLHLSKLAENNTGLGGKISTSYAKLLLQNLHDSVTCHQISHESQKRKRLSPEEIDRLSAIEVKDHLKQIQKEKKVSIQIKKYKKDNIELMKQHY